MKTGSTVDSLRSQGIDFEQLFARAMAISETELLVREIHLGETLPLLERIAGIVITGSPAFLTDLASWNFVARDYLQRALARELPILGICYGHQLLAWAAGGEVDFHVGGREIGTTRIRTAAAARDDALLGAMPETFFVQVSHSQTVTRLPAEAVLLASGDFDRHQAFALGERCWGLQFHPEFDGAVTRAYIRERRQALSAEGLNPQALLAEVQDSPQAMSLLPRFVAMARGG